MNLAETNFLDVTFSITNDNFKPYRKPNSEMLYINKHSNHPPTINKQLPKMIGDRISELSKSETEFNGVKEEYEAALKKSGFSAPLSYSEPNRNKRSRNRNIMYNNPPFNSAVNSDIGRQFLALLDKHFPPHNKYNKLFNRNTVKIC